MTFSSPPLLATRGVRALLLLTVWPLSAACGPPGGSDQVAWAGRCALPSDHGRVIHFGLRYDAASEEGTGEAWTSYGRERSEGEVQAGEEEGTLAVLANVPEFRITPDNLSEGVLEGESGGGGCAYTEVVRQIDEQGAVSGPSLEEHAACVTGWLSTGVWTCEGIEQEPSTFIVVETVHEGTLTLERSAWIEAETWTPPDDAGLSFSKIDLWDDGCGLLPSGHLRCWGHLAGWVPVAVYEDTDFVDVAVAEGVGAGLRADGSLELFGPRAVGGFGSLLDEPGVAVSAGGDVLCVVTEAGGALCEYVLESGGLGFGEDLVQVAANDEQWCGLAESGTLTCADPLSTDTLEGVTAVTMGARFGCYLDEAGAVACFGSGSNGIELDGAYRTIDAGDEHLCGIAAEGGTVGDLACTGGEEGSVFYDTMPDGAYADVAVGAGQACAVTEVGKLDCFGWAVAGRP